MGKEELQPHNDTPQTSVLARYDIDLDAIPEPALRGRLEAFSEQLDSIDKDVWTVSEAVQHISRDAGINNYTLTKFEKGLMKKKLLPHSSRTNRGKTYHMPDQRGMIALSAVSQIIPERTGKSINSPIRLAGIDEELKKKLGEENFTKLFTSTYEEADGGIPVTVTTPIEQTIIFEEKNEQKNTDKPLVVPTEKRKREGAIPVISEKVLIDELPSWTAERLSRVSREFEINETSEVVHELFSRDVIAVVHFIDAYVNHDFHNYDPYPENLYIPSFLGKLELCAQLLDALQQRKLKADNLADMYQGFVASAKDEGLKEIVPRDIDTSH